MRNTDSHPARKKLELSAGEPEQKINFLPRHGFTLLTVHQPPATSHQVFTMMWIKSWPNDTAAGDGQSAVSLLEKSDLSHEKWAAIKGKNN